MQQTNKTRQHPILEASQNCWCIEHAHRIAFLVDGAAYFRAFRQAAARAERSIVILGWDFDTRMHMLGRGESDGLPSRLGDFLNALLARRRKLHIYVLTWGFHVIYAFEREWLPLYKLGPHRRLHFQRDNTHPVGASHHQKVVVIDDAVAFAGGLDFALCRWDTPEHRANDPQRVFPDGRPYRPFHDVQMMVDGDAAVALGQLVRERWHRATGRQIPALKRAAHRVPWPCTVVPELEDVGVAIARTEPGYEGRPEVREVEHLYLDAIAAAQRWIYIETQYLTSSTIGTALIARLEEPTGPEILIVLHSNSDGWLEQHTMDVVRGRLLKRLRAADRDKRLGLYCPHVPGLGDQCMSVHSKVLVVDDKLLRVGSANLSNRSMELDTECDLAVEANGDIYIQQGIARFRNQLLGEHLGVDAETVAARVAHEGSLIAAVEGLCGGERTLKVFDSQIPPEVDSWVPDSELIDPDGPLVPDIMPDRVIPHEVQITARRRIIGGITLLLGLLGLAAAWYWTPLRAILDIPALAHYVAGFKDSPVAPLLAIGGYLLGGIAIVPVTILIAVTVLAFGPWLGFVYAFIGMTLSALLTFGIGYALGRKAVHRLLGTRLNRISRRLAQKGLLTVIAIRIVPVAPFSIINMIAGASHIRFRDYLVGTVIGELPGLLGVAIFVDQVHGTIQNPGPVSVLVTAAVAAALLLGAFGIRRWLSKRSESATPDHQIP